MLDDRNLLAHSLITMSDRNEFEDDTDIYYLLDYKRMTTKDKEELIHNCGFKLVVEPAMSRSSIEAASLAVIEEQITSKDPDAICIEESQDGLTVYRYQESDLSFKALDQLKEYYNSLLQKEVYSVFYMLEPNSKAIEFHKFSSIDDLVLHMSTGEYEFKLIDLPDWWNLKNFVDEAYKDWEYNNSVDLMQNISERIILAFYELLEKHQFCGY